MTMFDFPHGSRPRSVFASEVVRVPRVGLRPTVVILCVGGAKQRTCVKTGNVVLGGLREDGSITTATWYFVHSGMSFSDEGVFLRSLEDDHVGAVQFTNLGCFQGCYLEPTFIVHLMRVAFLRLACHHYFLGAHDVVVVCVVLGLQTQNSECLRPKTGTACFLSHDIHVIDFT